jgi:hypothetical protein
MIDTITLPRATVQQALEALKCLVETYEMGNTIRADIMDAEEAIASLKAALEQPDVPETDCGNMQVEWAYIPEEFNEWWDADRLTQTNPFREGSPAYWAWEGWQARTALKEPDRAQKMRDAGYTRRPTLREMAEPVQEPDHKPDCALLRIPSRDCDCGAEPEPAK